MRRKISAAWPHSTPLCLLLYRKPAQKARTVLLQPRHGGKIRIFPAKNRQRNTAENFLEKFQKFFQKGVAFCKVLWYNNQAFRKRNAQLNMGVFPSGQWGQTVNLLRNASVVRIHPRPPKNLSKDCCFSRDFCFLMFWNPLAMSTHRFSINFCRKCTADIHTRNILSKSVKISSAKRRRLQTLMPFFSGPQGVPMPRSGSRAQFLPYFCAIMNLLGTISRRD